MDPPPRAGGGPATNFTVNAERSRGTSHTVVSVSLGTADIYVVWPDRPWLSRVESSLLRGSSATQSVLIRLFTSLPLNHAVDHRRSPTWLAAKLFSIFANPRQRGVNWGPCLPRSLSASLLCCDPSVLLAVHRIGRPPVQIWYEIVAAIRQFFPFQCVASSSR